MIFNVLTVFAAIAVGALAAPLDVTYPHTGTIWTQAYTHNVTWVPGTGTGSILLNTGAQNQTLKSNVDLTTGRTEVGVPNLEQGANNRIFIVGSDGASGSSVPFAVGSPDTPGSPSGATTTTTTATSGASTATGSGSGSVTTTTSTSTAPGSSSTGAASSVLSSASSAGSSLSSSIASAQSSLSSAAASGASSISSHLSSALSSATGSATGSAASGSSSSSAALVVAPLGNMKMGAIVTAGLVVVSTLGGLAIF